MSDWQAIGDMLLARPGTFRQFPSVESVFADMGMTGLLSARGDQ